MIKLPLKKTIEKMTFNFNIPTSLVYKINDIVKENHVAKTDVLTYLLEYAIEKLEEEQKKDID